MGAGSAAASVACVTGLATAIIAGLVTAVAGAIFLARQDAPLGGAPVARLIRGVGPGPRKLMVVAHADDEAIFGGEHILADPPGTWKVLVLTALGRPDFWHRRPFRKRTGGAARSTKLLRLGAFEMWGLDDSSQSARWPDRASIVARLREEIQVGRFALVATHGPGGEYGHIQHIATHRVVAEAAALEGVRTLVFSDRAGFNPEDLSGASRAAALDAYAEEAGIVRTHTRRRWGLVPLSP